MGDKFQEINTSSPVVNTLMPCFIHIRLARLEDHIRLEDQNIFHIRLEDQNIFYRTTDTILAEMEAANFSLSTIWDMIF